MSRTQLTIIDLFETQTLRFKFSFRHLLHRPTTGMHSHDYYELVYRVKGAGFVQLNDGRKTPFSKKCVVIHSPKTRHAQILPGSPVEDICIIFDGPAEFEALIGGSLFIPKISDSILTEELFGLSEIHFLDTGLQRTICNHRLTCLVAGILGAVVNDPGVHSQANIHAAKAYNYVIANSNRQMRIERAADAAGISYDYLRHVFKRQYGKSIKEFQTEIRIGKAKDLLLHTTYPLKTIAELCCFDNERYLCKVFKACTGITPGEYRTLRAQYPRPLAR